MEKSRRRQPINLEHFLQQHSDATVGDVTPNVINVFNKAVVAEKCKVLYAAIGRINTDVRNHNTTYTLTTKEEQLWHRCIGLCLDVLLEELRQLSQEE